MGDEDRSDLLDSINAFKKGKLKKSVTNDRSAPILDQRTFILYLPFIFGGNLGVKSGLQLPGGLESLNLALNPLETALKQSQKSPSMR